MKAQTYIQGSYFASLPKRESRLPRQRFIEYYRDLHHMHERDLSAETFLLGSQYSYAELGDALLGPLAMKGKLQDIDLLFIVTWAHEFDPDYANVGAYFIDKYQLNCQVFDITDQGSLAFFTGLKLVEKFIQTSQLSSSLILGMEQTTIPRNRHDTMCLPRQDTAFALILKNSIVEGENKNYYAIHSAGIVQDESTQWISPVDLGEHAVKVFCKRNTRLHHTYLKASADFPFLQINAVPNHPGNFPLIYSLKHILKKEQVPWILLVDEDAETKDTGYFLLRRSGNGNRAI